MLMLMLVRDLNKTNVRCHSNPCKDAMKTTPACSGIFSVDHLEEHSKQQQQMVRTTLGLTSKANL